MLSNLPYKGTNDYLPEDYKKLEYIFSKWREVSKKYGYQEYLTPVLEAAEVYEAKSGEDIKRELFTLTDAGGRRISLRPEMTPSVTRLITKIYGKEVKPLRYFSIANFFRGERPQKGRDREFWQLNIDIFGEESLYADLEILMCAIDIMLAFNAPKNSFVLKLNHRKLIDYLLSNILKIENNDLKTEVVRKMDKFAKVEVEDFKKMLQETGLNEDQTEKITLWMTMKFEDIESEFPEIKNDEGYIQTKFLINKLNEVGYGEYVEYSTELIRGFDYYDGSIFEVFDLNPNFNRSLFGGGRYNGLAELFGSQKIPAVGFAPGSPISFFLDNWGLWPNFKDMEENYFVPVLGENLLNSAIKVAQRLRSEGRFVELGTEVTTISKALSYANKKQFEKVIILGEEELGRNIFKIKDMKTGEETELKIHDEA